MLVLVAVIGLPDDRVDLFFQASSRATSQPELSRIYTSVDLI